jgi:hypothetical protein
VFEFGSVDAIPRNKTFSRLVCASYKAYKSYETVHCEIKCLDSTTHMPKKTHHHACGAPNAILIPIRSKQMASRDHTLPHYAPLAVSALTVFP